MSGTATPGVDPVNHQEQADYVAISKSHGTDRRLHRVQGAPDAGELRNGERCEVACSTTLTSGESSWKAKPSSVFPPGYHPVCTEPECFGEKDA